MGRCIAWSRVCDGRFIDSLERDYKAALDDSIWSAISFIEMPWHMGGELESIKRIS